MEILYLICGSIITFTTMWLWLKTIKSDYYKIKVELDKEKEARITELKEMLPLLMDASNGLQNVIKSNTDNNLLIIESLKDHIDEKTKDISRLCKKI